MIKYAKIINQEIGLCEVGLGTNTSFYQSIGMTQLDVQQSDIDNNWYLAEKCPMKTDEEKEKEERERRNQEIDEKVKELYNMATVEMIKNNKENVDTYCSIINSLIECKS